MSPSDSKAPPIGSLISIIAWVLLSWLLVHIMAAFGFFMAVAYPIWWLFFPNKTFCFFCRIRKEGEWCPLCHKHLENKTEIYPKSVRSVVLNSLLLAFFTLVSFGAVYGEVNLLKSLGFPSTPKTVSFVIPPKGQYRLGEIFPVKIEITGIETPVNAVQMDLGFDPSKVEVVDMLTQESFANIFIQKEWNNEGGYARLTGGLPNPGFFAEKGIFATALFKGKAPGVVRIEFLPTSMVLANDGRGTNVLKDLASVSYLILPEKITEEEEKMQEQLKSDTNSEVLGDNTKSTQLTFYDETDVLGTKTDILKETETIEKTNHALTFLELLAKIDAVIVDQWKKVIDMLKKMFESNLI